MPLTYDKFSTERQNVWYALSDLFLDTELSPADLTCIADKLATSSFSIPELTSILEDEVAPVLHHNLLSMAGQWGMFDREVVIMAVEARLMALGNRGQVGWPFFVKIRRKWRMLQVQSDWQKILSLVLATRTMIQSQEKVVMPSSVGHPLPLADDFAEALRKWRAQACFFSGEQIRLPGKTVQESLDQFVADHGLTPIGAGWHELSRSAAQEHLVQILERDLAYGLEVMPIEQALQLAALFLAPFDQARFFSNTEVSSGIAQEHSPWSGTSGWQPLTDATFDTGIIAIDSGKMAMLWVADED